MSGFTGISYTFLWSSSSQSGVILFPGGHLAVPGDTFGCHSWCSCSPSGRGGGDAEHPAARAAARTGIGGRHMLVRGGEAPRWGSGGIPGPAGCAALEPTGMFPGARASRAWLPFAVLETGRSVHVSDSRRKGVRV